MKLLAELGAMGEERFLALYQDLSQDGFGPLDGEVAKLLKFRPQAIRKLAFAQRARKARSLLLARGNAELCYELLGSWLLKQRRGLVTGFLEATGVPHEEGMIADLETKMPDAKRLGSTVAELDRSFPPEDVTLYLALCSEQWPSVPELEALWRSRTKAVVPSTPERSPERAAPRAT